MLCRLLEKKFVGRNISIALISANIAVSNQHISFSSNTGCKIILNF